MPDRAAVSAMEDDLVCEYDSTWDTESDGDELAESTPRRSGHDKSQKSWGFWSNPSSRNLRAAKDMQNYRRGYPNISEDESQEERMNNLKFYLNEITSSPDEVSIETFHKQWKTDYKRLERVHSYIQWLFPLREPGVNYMASELTKKEIQEFRKSEEAKRRLVESYELMLGFYGIQLLNKETGEVKRADNWRERFANLERNMHNNLRITRILKSLGELGFEHYQAPLVRFFLEETLVRKNLSTVKRSVLDYFLFAVRNKKERRSLIKYAFQHYEPKDKFVWCPRKIQKRLKKKSEKKQEAASNKDSSAAEEGRSKSNVKDSESGNVCGEEKTCDSIMEVQKQTVGEASADSDKLLEGSSVDPEPSAKESIDGSQLLDCAEMDHSSSTELDPENGQRKKNGSQTKESICKSEKGKAMEPESVFSENGTGKQGKKKREGLTVTQNSGSGEQLHDVEMNGSLSPHDRHNEVELRNCPPNTESRRSARGGGGNVSPPPEEGRAEKQPRTDFSDVSVAISNGEMTGDVGKVANKEAANGPNPSAQSSVTVSQESAEMRDNRTEATDSHGCDDPMDTESSKSIHMDVC
ncbi:opioid growth factor receptor-like [Arapaima gigas]